MRRQEEATTQKRHDALGDFGGNIGLGGVQGVWR